MTTACTRGLWMGTAVILINYADRLKIEAKAMVHALRAAWPDTQVPQFRLQAQSKPVSKMTFDSVSVAMVFGVNSQHQTAASLLMHCQSDLRPTIVIADTVENELRHWNPLVLNQSTTAEVLSGVINALLHVAKQNNWIAGALHDSRSVQMGLTGEIQRLHDELALAATVQHELMPQQLPMVDGAEFDVLWRPAEFVSGDVYDVRQLDKNHVGLLLADAIGHGVPAAILAMTISRSLITHCPETRKLLSPGQVLAHLNQKLLERCSAEHRFATAVYGVLDVRTNVICIASAGHPPPLRLSSDGKMDMIETSGGLLGVFDQETFQERTIPLNINDRLLIYSDGVEAALNTSQGTDWSGLLPLQDAMSTILTAQKLMDEPNPEAHCHDDITLLCLKVRQKSKMQNHQQRLPLRKAA